MMLDHYLALDLDPSASEEEIRQRYLHLVRQTPPSRDPKRFQQITAAYEALKDRRSRMETAVFGVAAHRDCKRALEALVQARAETRKSPGLKTLLAAQENARVRTAE